MRLVARAVGRGVRKVHMHAEATKLHGMAVSACKHVTEIENTTMK